jgi:YbaB/EbfC DNA-binding family protein
VGSIWTVLLRYGRPSNDRGGDAVSYVEDVSAAESWLGAWQSNVLGQVEATREFTARVGGLTGVAESPDGRVRVTVDRTGVPTAIDLDRAVEGWPADRLSEVIMATLRRAQLGLTARVEQAAADTVGAGSETAAAVLRPYYERFPEPADPAGDEGPEWRR